MYVPKSRIVTNLYTNTKELVLKDTQEYYTGFYYKTFNGKYYTGKTPNDPPNDELVKVEDTAVTFEPNQPQNEIAYGDFPTIFDSLDTPGYDSSMVVKYALLQGVNLNESTRKFLPSQFFSNPTAEDYTLGSFTRYFCVKINQPTYLELNEKDFKALTNQDNKYLWEPYLPFSTQWTLVGNEREVFNTNRNIVLLTERRLKIRGLGMFLKENYLKFYK
jgi:hypothetical protein